MSVSPTVISDHASDTEFLDTPSNRFVALVGSVSSSINFLSYVVILCIWLFTSNDVVHLALAALAHVTFTGVFMSLIVKSEQTKRQRPAYQQSNPDGEHRNISRQERMAQQGGHTLMLSYFSGNASLGEYIRLVLGIPSASMNKIVETIILQNVLIVPVKIFLSWRVYVTMEGFLEIIYQKSSEPSATETNSVVHLAQFAQQYQHLSTLSWYTMICSALLMVLSLSCVVFADSTKFVAGNPVDKGIPSKSQQVSAQSLKMD